MDPRVVRVIAMMISEAGPTLIRAGMAEIELAKLRKQLTKEEAKESATATTRPTTTAPLNKDAWGPDTWRRHDSWVKQHPQLVGTAVHRDWVEQNVPCVDCQRSFFDQFVSAYRDYLKVKEGKQPFNEENLRKVAQELNAAVSRLSGDLSSSEPEHGQRDRAAPRWQEPQRNPQDRREQRSEGSTGDRAQPSGETSPSTEQRNP